MDACSQGVRAPLHERQANVEYPMVVGQSPCTRHRAGEALVRNEKHSGTF